MTEYIGELHLGEDVNLGRLKTSPYLEVLTDMWGAWFYFGDSEDVVYLVKHSFANNTEQKVYQEARKAGFVPKAEEPVAEQAPTG